MNPLIPIALLIAEDAAKKAGFESWEEMEAVLGPIVPPETAKGPEEVPQSPSDACPDGRPA
jgi:hypothetical protein